MAFRNRDLQRTAITGRTQTSMFDPAPSLDRSQETYSQETYSRQPATAAYPSLAPTISRTPFGPLDAGGGDDNSGMSEGQSWGEQGDMAMGDIDAGLKSTRGLYGEYGQMSASTKAMGLASAVKGTVVGATAAGPIGAVVGGLFGLAKGVLAAEAVGTVADLARDAWGALTGEADAESEGLPEGLVDVDQDEGYNADWGGDTGDGMGGFGGFGGLGIGNPGSYGGDNGIAGGGGGGGSGGNAGGSGPGGGGHGGMGAH